MTEETTELIFPSRIDSIDEATSAAVAVARRYGFDEEALFGIDIAVREAVTNAVVHGNQQDEAKPVEINFINANDHLVITVRDRGPGFNLAAVPDPTAPANLLKASGRGLLFIRNFMNEVAWEQHPAGGTVVRMTRSR